MYVKFLTWATATFHSTCNTLAQLCSWTFLNLHYDICVQINSCIRDSQSVTCGGFLYSHDLLCCSDTWSNDHCHCWQAAVLNPPWRGWRPCCISIADWSGVGTAAADVSALSPFAHRMLSSGESPQLVNSCECKQPIVNIEHCLCRAFQCIDNSKSLFSLPIGHVCWNISVATVLLCISLTAQR